MDLWIAAFGITLMIICLVITIIGAINWGLIGIFRFDLVAFLFGDMSWQSPCQRGAYAKIMQI